MPVKFELEGVRMRGVRKVSACNSGIWRLHASILLAAAASATGCFYSFGSPSAIADGRSISIETGFEDVKKLGRVQVVERTMLFGSCNDAIHTALGRLLEHAQARGGNRVQRVQFRGRRAWMGDPVCRRNLNYVWLLVPALFPIPTSVIVRGGKRSSIPTSPTPG